MELFKVLQIHLFTGSIICPIILFFFRYVWGFFSVSHLLLYLRERGRWTEYFNLETNTQRGSLPSLKIVHFGNFGKSLAISRPVLNAEVMCIHLDVYSWEKLSRIFYHILTQIGWVLHRCHHQQQCKIYQYCPQQYHPKNHHSHHRPQILSGKCDTWHFWKIPDFSLSQIVT